MLVVVIVVSILIFAGLIVGGFFGLRHFFTKKYGPLGAEKAYDIVFPDGEPDKEATPAKEKTSEDVVASVRVEGVQDLSAYQQPKQAIEENEVVLEENTMQAQPEDNQQAKALLEEIEKLMNELNTDLASQTNIANDSNLDNIVDEEAEKVEAQDNNEEENALQEEVKEEPSNALEVAPDKFEKDIDTGSEVITDTKEEPLKPQLSVKTKKRTHHKTNKRNYEISEMGIAYAKSINIESELQGTEVVGIIFKEHGSIHYYDPNGFDLKVGDVVAIKDSAGQRRIVPIVVPNILLDQNKLDKKIKKIEQVLYFI